MSRYLLAPPITIVVSFWLGVVGTVATATFIPKVPLWGTVSLAGSLVGLAVAFRTAFAFTAWSIHGFAP